MAHSGGFEPPTARFVAEYSIQLSYECVVGENYTHFFSLVIRLRVVKTKKNPLKSVGSLYGALGRIRTSDRSVRSRVLYPAELRVRVGANYRLFSYIVKYFLLNSKANV